MSSPDVKSVINGDYILIKERFLRETVPSLYFGLELDFQRLSQVEYINSTANFTAPEVGGLGQIT